MAYTRISNIERLLTHAVLILGCAVFAFPFIWMVATSFKAPRELSADQFRLLPHAPRPQKQSPFMDAHQFDPIRKPDGVPQAVWTKARPRLEALVTDTIARWTPRISAWDDIVDITPLNADAYRTEMTQGCFDVLHARLSDDARSAATRFAQDTGADASKLDAQAIDHGVAALEQDARGLLDDRSLRYVFDNSYRRFCLGRVRLRDTQYQYYDLYPTATWTLDKNDGQLVTRHDGSGLAQQARLNKLQAGQPVLFQLAPDTMPVDPDDTDRIFIQYRMDESWADIRFEVIAHGKIYRAPRPAYCFEREWTEIELRWPGGAGSPIERRLYQVLEPIGDAPPGAPDFALRCRFTPNTTTGAWLAKMSRTYIQAFREVPYARYMMTSFSLVILNVLLAIFSCTLVGYAFARLTWPGRDLCFGVLLATMMIPAQVTLIPGFLIFRYIGWYNTLLPLWVPAIFGMPFFIFLVRQFLKGIPQDLEDAARIDGCGFLGIYRHVMLPLVKPTIATISIFTFLGAWNNFMGPLIYVNDERLFPLALGLFRFNLRSGADMGLMMAGSFIMTLPIVILFFFVQRYFIQGITLSGTKG